MIRWHHQLNGHVKSFSCDQLFVTPWTIAYQASPSMGFSKQEYWSGLPFPSPGDLPDAGIEPYVLFVCMDKCVCIKLETTKL